MLHNAIARDAEEERANFAFLGVILFGLANQGHEYFLNDFFGRPGTAGHPKGVAIQTGLVPAIQLRKGSFFALGSTAQQNVISFGRNLHLSR